MNSDRKRWLLVAAAIAGATGVAIGAFGAHGLPDFLQSQGADAELVAKRLSQFDTGARYHLIHAVALLAIASISTVQAKLIRAIGVFLLCGIVLFSGSLYLLVVTNTPWLGAVTPLGGVCWIVAWVLLAFCRPTVA
jgi:uncharacterized membrane protein YgdD (TMEM256/DUF423 family)